MAEAEKAEPESPLTTAADRIRASAQYLLGAFAAVGAVLAAGLQLGDVGELSIDVDPLRFWLTFIGVAAAVIGITVAVASAAGVSTKSHVDLSWLIQNPTSQAGERISSDEELRQGIALQQLRTDLRTATNDAATTWSEIVDLGDPGADAAKQVQAQALDVRYKQQTARLDRLRRIRGEVLDVASYYRTKAAYDDAKTNIVIGALLAAAGISAFAWGANRPDAAAIDPGEVLPKTPSEVTVVLTDAGEERFRDDIGTDCDRAKVAAIAFDVRGTTYDVVTEKTDTCKVAQLTIEPDLGQVIPRVAEKKSDATTEAAGSSESRTPDTGGVNP